MQNSASKFMDQMDQIQKFGSFDQSCGFDQAALDLDVASAFGRSKQSNSAIDGIRSFDKAMSINKRAADSGSIATALRQVDAESSLSRAKSSWADSLTPMGKAQAKWTETGPGLRAQTLAKRFDDEKWSQIDSAQTKLLLNLAPRPMAAYELAATKIGKQALEINGTLTKSLQPFITPKRNPAIAGARPVGLDHAVALGGTLYKQTILDLAKKLSEGPLSEQIGKIALRLSGSNFAGVAAANAGFRSDVIWAPIPSPAVAISAERARARKRIMKLAVGQVLGLREDRLAAMVKQLTGPEVASVFGSTWEPSRQEIVDPGGEPLHSTDAGFGPESELVEPTDFYIPGRTGFQENIYGHFWSCVSLSLAVSGYALGSWISPEALLSLAFLTFCFENGARLDPRDYL